MFRTSESCHLWIWKCDLFASHKEVSSNGLNIYGTKKQKALVVMRKRWQILLGTWGTVGPKSEKKLIALSNGSTYIRDLQGFIAFRLFLIPKPLGYETLKQLLHTHRMFSPPWIQSTPRLFCILNFSWAYSPFSKFFPFFFWSYKIWFSFPATL